MQVDTSLKTPLEMFYHWEKQARDRVYMEQPVNGQYITFTWGETAEQVRRVASALLALNLPVGSHIAILSKNCAEWFISDLAIMLAGHISVPIYATAGEKTIQYVLEHANCPLIFVGKLDDTEAQLAAIPDGVTKIAFPYESIDSKSVDLKWSQVLQNLPYTESPVPSMEAVMSIVYTSGSTGNPKGVVHTFGSMAWSAFNFTKEVSSSEGDRLLSYLPLAHITERVLVQLASVYSGSRINFLESLDTFNRDINRCKPTMFISVPRLWTRFQLGVLANMPQKKLDFLLSIPIIKGIIAKKIRSKLGLDKAKQCASGSAPIPASTLLWFHRIGINISEGWGMTENAAYGTCCVPFRADKIGCIGRAYQGVDIRIGEEGEIQVKGPCNMQAYYLEPEKTVEAFTDDGYLRTGDKGAIDDDGYIKITGRLKEIFKTAKGKYIAPVPIESKLMLNSMLEQVCVTGSELKQPIALVVLSEEAQKLPTEDVDKSLLTTLNEVNISLESHAVLDRIVVMKDEWTIQNGLLTPTLKIKRHAIESHYDELINRDYAARIVHQ